VDNLHVARLGSQTLSHRLLDIIHKDFEAPTFSSSLSFSLHSLLLFIIFSDTQTLLLPSIKPTSNIFFEMAAAVLQPLQGLSLNGGIMDPSPISPNASRHGRGKNGGSIAKKTRGRGYSTVDERDVLISKALLFVLKRTVDESEEQEEGAEKLVADSEGWVDCDDIVNLPLLEYPQKIFMF
jgi:hypothetical protein